MGTGESEDSSLSPDLERSRFQWEVESRKKELALREKELTLKAEEIRRSAWSSPIVLSIIAAVVGLFGNAVVTFMQGRNSSSIQEQENAANIRLEREKLHSTLIVETMKTGNAIDAAKNLQFLVQLGLLDDVNGTIRKFNEHPENAPFLPKAAGSNATYSLTIVNSCKKQVVALIHYSDELGHWTTYGWVQVPAGTTVKVPVAKSELMYVHAETIDGKERWTGDYQFDYSGTIYGFEQVKIDATNAASVSSNEPIPYWYRLVCDA